MTLWLLDFNFGLPLNVSLLNPLQSSLNLAIYLFLTDHRLQFQTLLYILSSQSIFSTFYLCVMGMPIFDKASFHSWHKLQSNYSSLKCCELSLCHLSAW